MNCRIDWAPSRGLQAAVYGLALLACVSFLASAMPAWFVVPACVAACLHARWLVRRLRRAPAGSVGLGAGDDAILNFPAGAESLTGVSLRFRGPLATLVGTDAAGRTRRLLWWPDTLPSAARRQLHLVAGRLPSTSLSPLPPGY